MAKYKWRCNDPKNGGNTWVAENPQSCPTCGSDEIEIIGTGGPEFPWKEILIAGVVIIAIGLVIYKWDNIFDGPKTTSTIDGEVTTYKAKIEKHDNYF